MQKYKQAAISIAFLTVILSAGICAGNLKNENSDDKRNKSEKVAILESFEENDYEFWKKIVGEKTGIDKIITKSDFKEFVKARKAARNAQYDEAIKISNKLEKKLKTEIGKSFFS